MGFVGVALGILYRQYIDQHLKCYPDQEHQVGTDSHNHVWLTESITRSSDLLFLVTAIHPNFVTCTPGSLVFPILAGMWVFLFEMMLAPKTMWIVSSEH